MHSKAGSKEFFYRVCLRVGFDAGLNLDYGLAFGVMHGVNHVLNNMVNYVCGKPCMCRDKPCICGSKHISYALRTLPLCDVGKSTCL